MYYLSTSIFIYHKTTTIFYCLLKIYILKLKTACRTCLCKYLYSSTTSSTLEPAARSSILPWRRTCVQVARGGAQVTVPSLCRAATVSQQDRIDIST